MELGQNSRALWEKRSGLRVATAGILTAATASAAFAQSSALPEIVVTAPSPILRPEAGATAAASPGAQAGPTDLRPIVGNTFSPVTLLTSADIQRMTGATLGDTLFTLPGVTGNTFAPGASRPIIRGLDNARVRVQENGIGAMDVSTISEDHAVPIDPLATDKLEVIRGPATLRWGQQAIGGVVAAENNRIPDPTTPFGVHGVLKGAAASVDAGREGAVAVDGRGGAVAVHADYFHRKSEDYSIPGGGVQPNTAVDAQGVSAGASYIFADGFVGVAVSNYKSLYGIPGADAAAEHSRIDLNQTKVMSRGEFRTGGLIDTIRFWLGGTDYKHDERAIDAGADIVAATFKNREIEGRTELQFARAATAFGALDVAFGVQGGRQELATSGEAGNLLAPSTTNRFAAYLFNELTVSPTLRFQAAGRLGVQNVSGTAALFPADLLPDGSPVPEAARRRHFMPGSLSVGVLKDFGPGLQATGTISYSQRAPEAQELFSKGAHEASGTFEIGNPDLGKEAATSFEVGLRRPTGRFRFEATAYHTRYSGFIYKRLTGNSCGEEFEDCVVGLGEEFKEITFEQKDARFTGAEVAAQLDVAAVAGGLFALEGQYDFVHARFADGTNVPRIPPHRLGGGVSWRDANWLARVTLLHAFSQDEIAAEETPTPGYNLLNASVSYTHRFKPADGIREVTLGLVGTNLLDDDIRNATSFKKDEVLLPGRGIRLFASVRF
jgi:iron complex outermembrane receptor protein